MHTARDIIDACALSEWKYLSDDSSRCSLLCSSSQIDGNVFHAELFFIIQQEEGKSDFAVDLFTQLIQSRRFLPLVERKKSAIAQIKAGWRRDKATVYESPGCQT